MAKFFFADNTVLVNFALIGKVSVLERLLGGRAAWTSAIKNECADSANALDNEELRRVPGVFGEPIRLTDPRTAREFTAVHDQLRGPDDPKGKHRGEAETIALIAVEHPESIFVTDDGGARLVARDRAIRTASTCQLIRTAVRVKILTAQEAWEGVCALRRLGRSLRDSPTEEWTYMHWCQAA